MLRSESGAGKLSMWSQAGIALLMALSLGCNQGPPPRWSEIFVDETCTKRRLDRIMGGDVVVSTLNSDGTLTEVARFNTTREAYAAFPHHKTTSPPCSLQATESDFHPAPPDPNR